MLPPSSQAIFKQFKPTKLYSFPLNIPLSSFSMSWHEQTRKEKKKLFTYSCSRSLWYPTDPPEHAGADEAN